jgi:hypothetical protein
MNKPSRRAVVRTGVWAVPVVATAAAVPAFAGSVQPPVTIDATGHACKLPGESTHNGNSYFGYRMLLTLYNDTGSDQSIQIVSFTISGADTILDPTGTHIPVAASCTTASGGCDALIFVQSTNSAQRTATVCYTVDGTVGTFCTPVTFPTFNPCKCTPKDADPTDPASNCS